LSTSSLENDNLDLSQLPAVQRMHSQSGKTSDDGPQPPSPDKSAGDSYPLPELGSSQYKDEEPQHARKPGNYGDLELGSVPLLPADFPDDHRDSDDSNFDEVPHREDFRRDPPFSCTFAGLAAWCRGPVPPHIYRINPWFPKWQAAPVRMVERWAPRKWMKIALLLAGLVFWIAVFFSSLKASVFEQEVLGYGHPVKLSCHHRLWYVLDFQLFSYSGVQTLISFQ
jgi:hypothetical protein